MTPRCQLCGEFESENRSIDANYDVCFECVSSLIENEVERRGVERDAKVFKDFWGDTGSNREAQDIQDLKDAGRGHLT